MNNNYPLESEWDSFYEPIIINNLSIELGFLKIHTIEIKRNESYSLEVFCLCEKNGNYKPDNIFNNLKHHFSMFFLDSDGKKQYRIIDCIIVGIPTFYESITNGESHQLILNYCDIEIIEGDLEKTDIISDWFLNAPSYTPYFRRITVRKITPRYIRQRIVSVEEIQNDHSFHEISLDHFIFKYGNIDIIVASVPDDIGPKFSHKICIEYYIPEHCTLQKEIRKSICEIVKFFIGKNLDYVGSTFFSKNKALFKKGVSPSCKHLREFKNQLDYIPIPYTNSSINSSFEEALTKFAPIYYENRDVLHLNHALWRFFNIGSVPLELQIPLIHQSIEIISQSWLKKEHPNMSTKIIDDKELNILKEVIKNEIRDENRAKEIIQKIYSSNQISSGSKRKLLFEDLNIVLGKNEIIALKKRNALTHESFSYDDHRISELMFDTKIVELFFVRFFLILLGYTGEYIDHSQIPPTHKKINIPAGEI